MNEEQLLGGKQEYNAERREGTKFCNILFTNFVNM